MKSLLKKVAIGILTILGLIYIFHQLGLASAQGVSDKFDGECTGQETEGRCADKCPAGSYDIGIGKNGEAVCKLNPTGCPYGDSIPLGPDCDRHAPQVKSDSVESTDTSSVDYPSDFVGK